MLVPLIPHPPVALLAGVQPWQFVVEAEREAVGRVPRRWAVELMRIECRGIKAGVVFRRGTRVGSVEKSAFYASAQIEGNSVVVTDAIVLCV